MSISNYDAIVVGGGFAGATATRELQRAGLRTVLVEARDRLGGRTWTSEFGGRVTEMGGSWAHWHQAHIWAEITRYGLEMIESGVWSESERRTHVACGLDLTDRSSMERIGWIVDGKLKIGKPGDAFEMLNEGVRQVCANSYDFLTRPHDVFFGDVTALEAKSVRDRLNEVKLQGDVSALTEAMLATICGAHLEETGLLAVFRWYALAGHNPKLLWDCEERYKIKTGMQNLVETIVRDGGAEVRLSTPVARISQATDSVVVTTRDGSTLTARAAVITVPLNVLKTIEFTPGLSAIKQAVAAEGQSTHGVKAWVRVRGEHSYVGAAPSNYPFCYLVSEYHVDGDTVMYAFGADADAIDVSNPKDVATAVSMLMPDVEVVDSNAHDWTKDEFTLGTWSMMRPGQMTRCLKDLQHPDGRVFLAGSDYASGWNGFIDGAIESGLSTSRKVINALRQ